ncbi:MAG: hypothetical protein KC493_18250, partial [Bacteriovoracaceae bacterium]|nr:hypothetical protein [Bacteriovoracaceae bacterium]
MQFYIFIIILFLSSCSSIKNAANKPKIQKKLNKEAVIEDLNYLGKELQKRWAYVDLNNVNISKKIELAIKKVSTSESGIISEKDFTIIIK